MLHPGPQTIDPKLAFFLAWNLQIKGPLWRYETELPRFFFSGSQLYALYLAQIDRSLMFEVTVGLVVKKLILLQDEPVIAPCVKNIVVLLVDVALEYRQQILGPKILLRLCGICAQGKRRSASLQHSFRLLVKERR